MLKDWHIVICIRRTWSMAVVDGRVFFLGPITYKISILGRAASPKERR
jgi:hypothetical protein